MNVNIRKNIPHYENVLSESSCSEASFEDLQYFQFESLKIPCISSHEMSQKFRLISLNSMGFEAIVENAARSLFQLLHHLLFSNGKMGTCMKLLFLTSDSIIGTVALATARHLKNRNVPVTIVLEQTSFPMEFSKVKCILR